MPKRGERNPRPLPGDPSDPQGLVRWILAYLEALKVRGYSEHTIRSQRSHLVKFLGWCNLRGLERPTQILRPMLLRYQRSLFYYRKPNGKPLSTGSQIARLSTLRGLFRWLTRENVILSNPASELDLPRQPQKIPRQVLTPQEAETILAVPDVQTKLGLRDRTILEVFYSSGIRRSELKNLKVHDFDWERETLLVREGKGRKDRVVPLGERALAWCEKYFREVRPDYLRGQDEGFFFLTVDGRSFTANRLSKMVRDYVKESGVEKSGSCHIFRHTMATTMLENGADVRFIQEILGHAQLSSTQVYTRVSIRKLKEIHTATHPSARLKRTPKSNADDADELEEDLELSPHPRSS